MEHIRLDNTLTTKPVRIRVLTDLQDATMDFACIASQKGLDVIATNSLPPL